MDIQQVILVNEQDEQTGVMEKIEAHQKAVLHRAFSVFIFNEKGEMLLQQRAVTKYHSPGLWSNACCSHPQPGEETRAAAARRLKEELGIELPVQKQFDFIYKAEFENGLTEYEFDHVFTGRFDALPGFNREEVQDCCFQPMPVIKETLRISPQQFTAWFAIAFPEIEKWWDKNFIAAAT
jgi:isopentenyl-diphosphate delta-isomerase